MTTTATIVTTRRGRWRVRQRLAVGGDPRDQRVVLDLRPHASRLALPAVAVIGCSAAGSLGLALTAGAGPLAGGVVLAVAATGIGVLAVRPWLHWWSTRYVLTETRVVTSEGLLRRRRRDVPLTRVGEASYEQHGLLARLLGHGDLDVEVSGGSPGIRWDAVPRVDLVLAEVQSRAVRTGPPDRLLDGGADGRDPDGDGGADEDHDPDADDGDAHDGRTAAGARRRAGAPGRGGSSWR